SGDRADRSCRAARPRHTGVARRLTAAVISRGRRPRRAMSRPATQGEVPLVPRRRKHRGQPRPAEHWYPGAVANRISVGKRAQEAGDDPTGGKKWGQPGRALPDRSGIEYERLPTSVQGCSATRVENASYE